MGILQLADGLNLMLYGMGTVFVFLALLVVCTNVMSALVLRFYPETLVEAPSPVKRQKTQDPRMIAVIEAAIAEHRKSR